MAGYVSDQLGRRSPVVMPMLVVSIAGIFLFMNEPSVSQLYMLVPAQVIVAVMVIVMVVVMTVKVIAREVESELLQQQSTLTFPSLSY